VALERDFEGACAHIAFEVVVERTLEDAFEHRCYGRDGEEEEEWRRHEEEEAGGLVAHGQNVTGCFH
jgi:hypothetical protein